MRLNFETLIFDLPDDIRRAKDAGDFTLLKALLEERLGSEAIPPMLRDRLLIERELMHRWERRYPYTRAAAIQRMQERVSGFTEEEFDALEKEGCMDYIWLNGEKRYLSSFAGTLIIMKQWLAQREINPDTDDDGINLMDFIHEIKQNGESKYRFRIKSTLEIDNDTFDPKQNYLVHIPVPAAAAQQPADEIEIISDGEIAPCDTLQRTVAFRGNSDKYIAEFAYTSHLKYVNPFEDAPHIVYPAALPPCADDLSEQYPHIAFTPYLKQLAKLIAGDETRPLYLAKRVYDYITSHVRYSYMRSYIMIDRHAEYAALNLKGDCGIQAILFITLCRILGIPARWQSGLTVHKQGTGMHDWAQFYTEEFGWLFADPSFGGSGYRKHNMEKREYYFGNLDPFRMVANRRYQSEFDVPKQFERDDPYDSQCGEVETESYGLDIGFDKDDETLEFTKLC